MIRKITLKTSINHQKFEALIIRSKGFKAYNLVLNENWFWDITFDVFQGEDISLIDQNAFGKASKTIKQFIIAKDFHNDYVKHEPNEYDIWKMLNRLIIVCLILNRFISNLMSMKYHHKHFIKLI